ncbi:DNA-(apurinic or apyrimidinic site) endonuclease 2-like [Salvelinus fontinalis]|uniref:DNA-(apurinic or apyrimidinic site) endonuclease 2-like n=1 Tax=Salvelinus fontinalis TaxID=8038 RepID=UPI0024862B8F|nr:DNA-(apurinic or apyrimidinic site) endonuclease 2-like [Salvelinus fontinalis]
MAQSVCSKDRAVKDCPLRRGSQRVDTYCKDSATPFAAEEGLTGLLTTNHKMTVECYGDQGEFSSEEQHVLDNEGRAVLTQHRGEKILLSYDLSHDFLYFKKYCNGKFQLLTCCCTEKPSCVSHVIHETVMVIPRADPEKPEWKLFELQFYKLLQYRAEAILEAGSISGGWGDLRVPESTESRDKLWKEEDSKAGERGGPTSDSTVDPTCSKKMSLGGFWKTVLRGSSLSPPCEVHGELRLRRAVKAGPNFGRQFFVCNRPQGHASSPVACCSFFSWVDNKGK